MKCLVAPDLRQTLTLLPLICDKKDLFLPLICNKSKKLLNSYSIFPFYSLLEAELAFGNLLGFFWLVGGYEVNAGIYAFLNLLHLVDGPYIHLHAQVVTLFNPVRIFEEGTTIVVDAGKAFLLDDFGSHVAAQIVNPGLWVQLHEFLAGMHAEGDVIHLLLHAGCLY